MSRDKTTDRPGDGFRGFRGGDRFELRQHLGSGGMGAVYRVYDRKRGVEVALKVLSDLDAAAIMRFKREFRALADVSHRNLVSLHELLFAREQWFFTMELIDGQNLHRHLCGERVRDDRVAPSAAQTRPYSDVPVIAVAGGDTAPAGTTTIPTEQRAPVNDRERASAAASDFVALRRALRQLAEGVHGLHELGYLHCDIKPNNVLVSSEGRVVLLDFGLITPEADRRRPDEELLGTPAYMSPEHIFGGSVTRASDWFSVGVVLYQLLTGRWPRSLQWHLESQTAGRSPEIPAPRALRPEIPEDLDALCVALLDHEPSRRPPGAEILRRLGADPSRPSSAHRLERLENLVEPLGRDDHRAVLDHALTDLERGRGSVLYVRGGAGMGKSTLVRGFLCRVAEDPAAVILEGRCYQREAIPHKALDSIIDSLCRYLTGLPGDALGPLLPRGLSALVRVFPVLQRVVERARGDDAPMAEEREIDPRRLRRRASRALRQLLAAIAAERPVVLFIDDLQWGDLDSAPFLEDLMQPPDTPRLLLILAHRTDGQGDNPLLDRRLFTGYLGDRSVAIRHVDVGALSLAEAEILASDLLRASGRSGEVAPAIARESGGDPLFIHELVRHTLSNPLVEEGSLTLEAVLRGRVSALDDHQRLLVEVLAVAGRPLPASVARAAIGVEPAEIASAARSLRAARLLQVSEDEVVGERLELHHDRIREVVRDHLDEDVAQRHSRDLAAAEARSDVPDADALTAYHLDAGDHAAAARYALIAARNAAATFSFVRAAERYELAIQLGHHPRDERLRLLIALGEARQAAGHSRAAAEAFSAAGELSDGLQALDLRRRAGGELLRVGAAAQGLAVMTPVLTEVGVSVPAGRWRALAQLFYWRLRLRLRGLRFHPRDPQDIPARKLLRVRTCLDIATGTVNTDPVLASAFSARALTETLAIGAESILAYVGSLEVTMISARGQVERAERLRSFLDAVSGLSQSTERAVIARSDAMVHLFAGRFSEAQAGLERAMHTVRRVQLNIDHLSWLWLRDIITQYLAMTLLIRLDFAEMRRTLPQCLAEAAHSGNRQFFAILRMVAAPMLWLNAGDPDGARREITSAMAELDPDRQDRFALPQFLELISLTAFDLYRGDGVAALRHWERSADRVRASLVMRIPLLRGLLSVFHASALVGAACSGHPSGPALLDRAARAVRRLRGISGGWADTLAEGSAGNIALARGDRAAGLESLSWATELARANGLTIWAEYYRWVLGTVVGGARGARLIAESDASLACHETADRLAMACTLNPALIRLRPSVAERMLRS